MSGSQAPTRHEPLHLAESWAATGKVWTEECGPTIYMKVDLREEILFSPKR